MPNWGEKRILFSWCKSFPSRRSILGPGSSVFSLHLKITQRHGNIVTIVVTFEEKESILQTERVTKRTILAGHTNYRGRVEYGFIKIKSRLDLARLERQGGVYYKL